MAIIENLYDLERSRQGALSAEGVRRVDVADALLDTGASMLSMPRRLIEQPGLRPLRTRPVLIGQVPLELMDLVVDRGSQRLIGNPAHGGEQVLELY